MRDKPVELEVVDERMELAERAGDHVEDARVAQELDSRRQRLDVLQLGLQASDFERELHTTRNAQLRVLIAASR